MTDTGVYVGNDPSALAAYSQWAGVSPNNVLNFLNSSSWSAFDSSIPYETSLWKSSQAGDIWSVPLTVSGTTLSQVASGSFNSHFLLAAESLAQTQPSSDGNIYIRLGWEFNGSWMPWAASGNEAAYIAAYQDVVNTFRSVSNKFKFVWDVNNSGGNVDPTTCYPGNKYVDVIGEDVYYNQQYDSSNISDAFGYKVDGQFGLKWQQEFALTNNKPTAISEWGIDNNKDGSYTDLMFNWIKSHNMVYENYWNSNAEYNGKLSDGQYPNAGLSYLSNIKSIMNTVGLSNSGGPTVTGNTGTSSPVVETLDSVVPSVSLTSPGGTTNTAVLTISGSSSTPGAGVTYVAGTIVTLTDNGAVLGTAQVDGNGNWSTQLILPNQGQNVIVATDTDTAGNTGTNSVNYHLLTPPTVAFGGTTAAFVNGVTPIMTGSVSSYSGVASVEIYEGDPTNGGQDLGAATVNSDGTWIFQANIGAGDFNSLTAVVTDASGETATNTAPYELVTGITGEPYRAQEFDSMSDGSYSYTDFGKHGNPLVGASDNGDGTHTIEGSGANGQVLQSVGNDIMTGYGVSERFVFVPHFGQDEVTDFVAMGQTHDTIDLTNTHYSTLAQVLRNTTMSGGSVEIHLNSHDTITLDGVTKAQLKAHPRDFAFG